MKTFPLVPRPSGLEPPTYHILGRYINAPQSLMHPSHQGLINSATKQGVDLDEKIINDHEHVGNILNEYYANITKDIDQPDE